MKKIIVFLLTLTLMLTNLNAVLAEGISAPPASQISADLSYASVERTFQAESANVTRGKPSIIFTRASIGKSSSTSVTIIVTTQSDISSDKIGGQIRLQRWINNSWSPYQSVSFWSYYTDRATKTQTFTVPTGYYYRLVVAHIASTADGTSSKLSTTGSVLVN